MSEEKPYLYILMRTDLPSLNPGKAMAQAAHASNQFVAHVAQYSKPMDKVSTDRYNMYSAWAGEAIGFGTTVVLGYEHGSSSLVELLNYSIVQQTIASNPIIAGTVLDPTYPVIIQNTEIAALLNPKFEQIFREDGTVICLVPVITCGYIFGYKEDVADYIKDLKLHP